ncbi:YceI family protein [Dyadobacter sp. LHD-138]|uniref:YceI family protein n=1 Tax=Dyadobacter sp. LHD-138 TaxID=3071413 RepID=UPI0027E16391|nr:YceI family protein [Dyadobacter sp. LHD-138]MDQ6479301.1 YceI family protein [Dyadobacter sp. LHD-138]
MRRISLLILFSVLSVASFAQTTWKSDKPHSQLKFDITHLGVSTISGAFTDFEATIKASKPDFSDAVFTLNAKTASINTGVEKRNDHLKSPDFFDAATNPELTFKSTGMKKVSEGKYQLSGDLMMHGVTKPVTLDLWYRGTIINQMSKKPVAGFRATGIVKRADFGIGPKFPAPMLSEEVLIIADGEFGQE